MPMPFSPKRTVTGDFTVWPLCGVMMYTSAPGADGVRSWAQAAATAISPRAAMAKIRMATLSSSKRAALARRSLLRHMDAGARCGLKRCRPFGLNSDLLRRKVIDVNQLHHLAIVLAQRDCLGLRNDAARECLLDAPG